jgi:peroxiredoxin
MALVAVFAVAGFAKLADRPGTQKALVDFGLPLRFARPIATLLPFAEFAAALLLMFRQTAWRGSLAASALLLIFTVAISYNLWQGRRPDCNCFGQLHSTPIGWSTLARNGVLMLLAGVILWRGPDQPGLNPVAFFADLSIGSFLAILFGLLVAVAIAVQSWFMLSLLRQNGRLLLRVEALEAQLGSGGSQPAPRAGRAALPGLAVGLPAPTFSLLGLDGKEWTLGDFLEPGKQVLLLFTDPGCGPCTALMSRVGVWQREHAADLSIVLASRGTPDKNLALQRQHGLTNLLLQNDREVSMLYEAYGTPSAVLIRPDGTIGSPLAGGADAIASLVASAIGLPQHERLAPRQNGLPNGSPAPLFSLSDLDGDVVQLEGFRGRPSLLLFWNPSCGFCQRMLGQLKEWEAKASPQAPQLIVISLGTVEENRAMGLRSRVLLDHEFATGYAFEAGGTPSAVLIDHAGNIASDLAIGASAILALVNQDQRAPALS